MQTHSRPVADLLSPAPCDPLPACAAESAEHGPECSRLQEDLCEVDAHAGRCLHAGYNSSDRFVVVLQDTGFIQLDSVIHQCGAPAPMQCAEDATYPSQKE
jgi:hypothetical protein